MRFLFELIGFVFHCSALATDGPVFQRIPLKANKTGDLVCLRRQADQLSPVLSLASKCVHLCLIHNLLVAPTPLPPCKLERKTVSQGKSWPASSQATAVGALDWRGVRH